jgi:hypothetical protein
LLASSPALAAPGDLDPTFGNQGDVDLDSGPFGIAVGVVADPDGRLVVAGSVAPSTLAVVRFLEDGALFPSRTGWAGARGSNASVAGVANRAGRASCGAGRAPRGASCRRSRLTALRGPW